VVLGVAERGWFSPAQPSQSVQSPSQAAIGLLMYPSALMYFLDLQTPPISIPSKNPVEIPTDWLQWLSDLELNSQLDIGENRRIGGQNAG